LERRVAESASQIVNNLHAFGRDCNSLSFWEVHSQVRSVVVDELKVLGPVIISDSILVMNDP
jgi:hypothetical protein